MRYYRKILSMLLFMTCRGYCHNIYVGSTGLLFPYSLGALAYIKTNLKPESYHLSGVSGGTWCSLIFHFENDLRDHDKLWNTFIGNKNTVIQMFDKKSMEDVQHTISSNILKKYKNADVSNIPLSIYVTKIDRGGIKNMIIDKFQDIEDIVGFSRCSSYIPFVCGNSLWTMHKNKKYIDGVFFHKKPIDGFDINIDVETLLAKDGNRYTKRRIILDIDKSRELFKDGWQYAKNNINL